MTSARQHLAATDAPGTYQCVSRCVRGAFLCGRDTLTGRSFEHRKRWVEERVLVLAESFAVSVHALALTSTHLHVIVHINPQASHQWTGEQVARRWIGAFGSASPDAPPLEERVRELTADGARIDILRSRLGSLSWFMRGLLQPIARRSNREDGVTGRFWEGQFKSRTLVDEHAMRACMRGPRTGAHRRDANS